MFQEYKIDPISSEKQHYDGESSSAEDDQEEQHHDKYNIDNVSLYMESKSGIQKSDAIEENDESPVKQLR